MKKAGIFILWIMVVLSASAQSPQGVQYQAIVRDVAGTVIPDQDVTFRFSVVQTSPTGTAVYVETQPGHTNDYGLVTFKLGMGSPETGTFSAIQWENGPYYLKVEADPAGGVSFLNMGTTQLLSVPYALYAAEAGNVQVYTAGTGISVSGSTITNTSPDQTVVLTGSGATSVTGTYPNFTITSTDNVNDADASPTNEIQSLSLAGNQLSISSGNTVTLPSGSGSPAGTTGQIQYNNSGAFGANSNLYWDISEGKLGVGTNTPGGRMVIQGDPSASATEPLFEIKSRTGHTVMVVYEDSVHFYVKDDNSKANKGGFAVSGRNTTKQVTDDYFVVSPDSTRIYTGDSISGFGVESLTAGGPESYMKLTPYNYFIGHNSGDSITTGLYNSTLGYKSGLDLSVGSGNIIIGYEAGYNADSSYYNTVMGYKAGHTLGYAGYNVLIGYETGYNTTSGSLNTALGSYALRANGSGSSNVAVGNKAMFTNTSGVNNTAVGSEALYLNTTGRENTAIGLHSLYANTIGQRNTATGVFSMAANTDGSDNSAFGESALAANTLGINNTALGSGSLNDNLDGDYNTGVGMNALNSNTTANYNTAVGCFSLRGNLTGEDNTSVGAYSMYNNTAGDNTALGSYAMYTNSSGSNNVAVGSNALTSNSTAGNNTAVGGSALFANSTGADNTAVGASAMSGNTDGTQNTAVGRSALSGNGGGDRNTATGYWAMYYNYSGNDNSAYGFRALRGTSAGAGSSNTAMGAQTMRAMESGSYNTAMGTSALYTNTAGSDNVAIGSSSLFFATGSYNTGMGSTSLTMVSTGQYNTAVGNSAGSTLTTGSNNTLIGSGAGVGTNSLTNTTALGSGSQTTASDQVRIGNPSVSSIGGYVDFTVVSDERFKVNIQENVSGLTFIKKLKPVTYQLDVSEIYEFLGIPADQMDMKSVNSKSSVVYTGFLAQDVEQAAIESGFNFSGLDAPKNEKDHYGLRYATFVVPIIKAIQEQQVMIEQQQQMLEELKKENQELRELLNSK